MTARRCGRGSRHPPAGRTRRRGGRCCWRWTTATRGAARRRRRSDGCARSRHKFSVRRAFQRETPSIRERSLRLPTLLASLLVLALAVPASAGAVATILPGQAGLGDLDARSGKVAPTAAQKQEASGLGARVEGNRDGTPASLIAADGWLTSAASGSASASAVARGFISSHRSLFKLSAADVSALDLVHDSKLVQSDGHAVVFRRRFGGQA